MIKKLIMLFKIGRKLSTSGVISSIYEIYKPVIEASGEFSWKHGAGGEGYKGFETQKELLDESVWDQALRPDPAFYS